MNYIDNKMLRDDQLCPYSDPSNEIGEDSWCDKVMYKNSSHIYFVVCCREDYCNMNDTLWEEFLNAHLGMYT